MKNLRKSRFRPISNVSNGPPKGFLVNRSFMVLAIGPGLTRAILDRLDQKMMTHIPAAETPAGRDDYSTKYLKANRAGKLIE